MVVPIQHIPKTSPKMRGVRLTMLRVACGCRTAKEFCEDSDLNTKTFNEWEVGRYNGVSRIGARKAIKQAERFGVYSSFNWIMYGVGQGPAYEEGDIPTESEEKEAIQIANEVMPFISNRSTVELTISDESMAPEYIKDDLIAGVKLASLDDAVGLDCIVQLSNGNLLLRYVAEKITSRKFLLQANDDEDEYSLKMAAPVLFRRRKFQNLRKK